MGLTSHLLTGMILQVGELGWKTVSEKLVGCQLTGLILTLPMETPDLPNDTLWGLKKRWLLIPNDIPRILGFFVFLFVFLHVFPRDPGSPSENGFMEPKYHSFRRWLYTPCSSSDMVIGSLGILTYVNIYIYTHHLVGSLHHSLNFHPKTNIFEKIAHSVEMVPLQMALQTGKNRGYNPLRWSYNPTSNC